MLIDWIGHTRYTFKSNFRVQLAFWICVLVLWIHKGYFVVKRTGVKSSYTMLKMFGTYRHIHASNYLVILITVYNRYSKKKDNR